MSNLNAAVVSGGVAFLGMIGLLYAFASQKPEAPLESSSAVIEKTPQHHSTMVAYECVRSDSYSVCNRACDKIAKDPEFCKDIVMLMTLSETMR